MKISPINTIKISYPKIKEQNCLKSNYNSSFKEINEPPHFNAAVNFTGKPFSLTKNIKTQLKALDDIHCPVCGVVMPNENKYTEILNQAAGVHTLKEYVDVLNQNKKYFPQKALPLVKFINDIYAKRPDKPIEEVIAFARSGANRLIRKGFHQSAEYIREMALKGSFSNEDLELLDSQILLLKSYTGKTLPKYNDFKSELKKTISSLEPDNPEKWEMYTNIRNNVAKEYTYLGFLKYETSEEKNIPEQVFVIKNILDNSIADITTTFYNPLDKRRGNNILMCSRCIGSRTKPFNFYVAQRPEITKNIKLYLTDIGKAVCNDKLKSNELYLTDILKMFNANCQNKTAFTLGDVFTNIDK